jgi:hypothetical protein
MSDLYSNLKKIRIILYFITALFLLLYFLWHPFLYFATVCGILIFVNLATLQILNYNNLKKEISEGYYIYLVECYNEGKISKEQLDKKDDFYFSEYSNSFRAEKLKNLLFFILWFGLTAALVTAIIKGLF